MSTIKAILLLIFYLASLTCNCWIISDGLEEWIHLGMYSVISNILSVIMILLFPDIALIVSVIAALTTAYKPLLVYVLAYAPIILFFMGFPIMLGLDGIKTLYRNVIIKRHINHHSL